MEYIFLAWLWPLMMSLTFLDSGIWVWITWWWLDGTCKRASRLPYRPLLPVLPCHIFSCRFADCLQFIKSVRKCLRCEVCWKVALQSSITTAWAEILSSQIQREFLSNANVTFSYFPTFLLETRRWKPPSTFLQCLLALLLQCHSASSVWSWRHDQTRFPKRNQSV